MTVPLRDRFTVFDAIVADTTARIPTEGSLLPEHALSIVLEVVGADTPNWTLAMQGRTHQSGTFTNLDFIEIWQAGAAALSNSTLTVNDTTRRFYLIPNCPQFVQLVATFTGGTLTIHGSYTSEIFNQFLLTTSRGSVFVEGPVAADAVAAGNPLLDGGFAHDSTQANVADGDMVRARYATSGEKYVVIAGEASVGDGVSGPASVAVRDTDDNRPLAVHIYGLGPDTAGDRARMAGDTAGSGLGVLLVSPTGHQYDAVTADEQILAAAGRLHTITIHNVATAGVITVYDNTAESGTVIATLTLVAGESFFTLHYDVSCATGLFIGYDSTVAADLTVSSSI